MTFLELHGGLYQTGLRQTARGDQQQGE